MRLSVFAFSAVLFTLTACQSVPQTSPSRFKQGATPVKPGKTIVFSPICKGIPGPCTQTFRSTLLGRISSELELEGYQMIDGEELFAAARKRQSVGADAAAVGSFGAFLGSATIRSEQSLTYKDLPPAGKRALFEDARANGRLELTVMVGDDQASSPWYDVHVFEVTARYTVGSDDTFGWVARCSAYGENRGVVGGLNVSYTQAADTLGRCLADEVLSE